MPAASKATTATMTAKDRIEKYLLIYDRGRLLHLHYVELLKLEPEHTGILAEEQVLILDVDLHFCWRPARNGRVSFLDEGVQRESGVRRNPNRLSVVAVHA